MSTMKTGENYTIDWHQAGAVFRLSNPARYPDICNRRDDSLPAGKACLANKKAASASVRLAARAA